MQQVLAEGVVAVLLVLVEALHVLGVARYLERGGYQRLPQRKGHDLDAGDEVGGDALVLLAVDALVVAHGHVLEVGDPSGPVHAHAVVVVVHAHGVEPVQRSRVHVVGEGAPEDFAAFRVHLLHEVGDLFVDHAVRHPVHVVEQRGHRDGRGRFVNGRQHGAVH